MRALWSAASGMKAQQLNIDNISNNLANVNTTGYKKMRVEFKDLLYENIKDASIVDGEGSPVNLQVGHGVMYSATSRNFENGGFQSTENDTDFALDGRGFFVAQNPAGERIYTRDGSFKLDVDGDTRRLVTSEGYFVLSEDDDYIEFSDTDKDFTVDEMGAIKVKTEDGTVEDTGLSLAVVDFLNPDGLEAVGGNFLKATNASGEEMLLEGEERDTKIYQGYLENSNVQIVEEMIKLITAQRAYDINSKTIQTADEMMQTANSVKR
ncbi:flagellar basal-body rod protein FlgG [Peptoclostridium litorale DSM 5388]|uniref:Flagellar basal-body rod protein FlgG n=1 Tax=Peptoclostridium litorale DSM 5388 TaxID=1121324 RepID=A0A069RKI8_PEPLI|nr:flagellar basal-body rod protein FlgG [Peptoclostridium litorale]KDR94742.1 flagellar basal-body rod protein FlgG [Peptoclostridium litorale DSM 5388]SIN91684.1 flagellar basal-body rod protein FlgG [Peptoclostridium litorale DSM 5388]